MFNEGSILPDGVLVNGQYGIKDCVLSVPTLVTSRGVEQILEYPLTAEELAQLRLSADYLQRLAAQVAQESGLQ